MIGETHGAAFSKSIFRLPVVPIYVTFEWDEAKRLANLDRRGLDFEDADLVFDDRPVTTTESRRNNEDRFVSTAEDRWQALHGRVDVARRKSTDYFIQES